jgi:hypothetical protein
VKKRPSPPPTPPDPQLIEIRKPQIPPHKRDKIPSMYKGVWKYSETVSVCRTEDAEGVTTNYFKRKRKQRKHDRFDWPGDGPTGVTRPSRRSKK